MIVVSIGDATTAGSRPSLETTSTSVAAMHLEKNTAQMIVMHTANATAVLTPSKSMHLAKFAAASVIPHSKATRISLKTTFQ